MSDRWKAVATLLVIFCFGCGGESKPLAGVFFTVDEMTGGEYEYLLKGCTAVLPPEQRVEGGDITRFGKNPTDAEPSPLEVVHESDDQGFMVTIYFDKSVVEEKHYTLEFLQSGTEDRFEVVAGSTRYRFTYHGEADCES